MNFATLFPTRLNVWPVVQRELREGARRPVNHRLRFLSAGVGTLMLGMITANSHRPTAEMGGWLFWKLHTLLAVLIALVAPALTADCIAREKREGTLGLLFMTPLSAGGIVAGKALTQGLRAFTLWLAVLPILAIPFMTGGVTRFDALSALSMEFCATVLCLAAGLLASALAKGRNTVFILAFLLTAFFLCLFCQVLGLLILFICQGTAILAELEIVPFTMDAMSLLFEVPTIPGQNSFFVGSLVGSIRFGIIWRALCLIGPLAVVFFFFLVALFASQRIERSWQDKIPSPRRESWVRRYCTPLWRGRFRRKMQKSLDWNPIAWLQQYSWKARLSKWGLALVFALVEFLSFVAAPDRHEALLPLLLILAGIYTFFGVSGFLEEKRNGALELLLVTPISVNKLILGRVWGLWQQFLPAGLILVFDYGWLYVMDPDSLRMNLAVVLAYGFLALPIFATYAALRVKNLIVATVLTWIALIVPAIFAVEIIQMFTDLDEVGPVVMALMNFLSYGGFTLLTCFLLRHSLSRRIYSF